MWTSTSAARLAVVFLLCLPTALACGDTGDDAGGSADGGTSGGGVPAPPEAAGAVKVEAEEAGVMAEAQNQGR
jgi:hypothetical protein